MSGMRYEIVSPERLLAAGEAEMLTIPGVAGDFGALAGHAPFLTTLRPGVLTVTRDGGTDEFFVIGGFAEVNPEGVSVLAEEALPKHELTRETLEARIEAARADLEQLDGDDHTARETSSQRINDLLHILEHLFN